MDAPSAWASAPWGNLRSISHLRLEVLGDEWCLWSTLLGKGADNYPLLANVDGLLSILDMGAAAQSVASNRLPPEAEEGEGFAEYAEAEVHPIELAQPKPPSSPPSTATNEGRRQHRGK